MLCKICSCSLQNTSSHRRRSRGGYTLMQLAAIAAVVLLCSTLPLETTAVPMQRQPTAISAALGNNELYKRNAAQNRNLCTYFSLKNELSCSYHDSCVEGIYKCTDKGFHIGYSKPRCNAVKQLRQSLDDCSWCLKHQEFVDWSIATEECFQPKLKLLAESWSTKISHPLALPDPQKCLEYEIEALEELKSCYKQHITPVCDLLTDELNENFVNDLQKLASVVAVSDYYKPRIHDHLRGLIGQCSAETASLTAKTALPVSNHRSILCVASDSNYDDFLSQVPKILKRPTSEFVYADSGMVSDNRDSMCKSNSPPEGKGSLMTNYRLIQWTPDASSTVQLKSYYEKRISASTLLFFYEYAALNSSCGNGLREVGEMCDTFGELGNEEYGCNSQCKPFDEYECTVGQLSLSSCAKSSCGDGLRSSLEECDDGNNDSGDGCSYDCQIEPLFKCTDLTYNSTSVCKPVEQVSSAIPVLVTPTTSIAQSSSVTEEPSASPTTTRTTVTATPYIREPTTPEGVQHSSAQSNIRTSPLLLWLSILVVLLSTHLILLR